MSVKTVQVFQLSINAQFQGLSEKERRYAHHLSRAAWLGARIILNQVSPEAESIFDFIVELHHVCRGNWASLAAASGVGDDDLRSFLTYAATFLSNVGNYFGAGDQKLVPSVNEEIVKRLSRQSSKLETLYSRFAPYIHAIPPFSLGYPGKNTQSAYYPGELELTESEIGSVSRILEQHGIFPENTRIRKGQDQQGIINYEVLIASASEDNTAARSLRLPDVPGTVKIMRGDYAVHLERICAELSEASQYTANELQSGFLRAYIESFQTGSLDAYRESQRIWVRDRGPRVENIFGFVEPYRDPHGIRAEFEGLVAISDDNETALLANLVENSAKFIRRLPWTTDENDGKGPFEKSLFDPPDFSSIHSLAYCSSIIFPGINLPNYNDIRQGAGFKNVIVANRMAAESDAMPYPFIDPAEEETFKKHKFPAYYWWVVLHELLGHGTGQMMVESESGKFNFDSENPPVSPLTGSPITSWYKPGQTWTGQFADLATTVDECRAELVGAYLMDDPELLELFGFNETSDIRAADLTYNLYQQLGVDGLRGLANFNMDSGQWGQAHSRAHFAMLKCLLTDGAGIMEIVHNKSTQTLRVRVDRAKISAHGKAALGGMLLRLHMYRCTADVAACREYYEGLSRVDGKYLEWRETVIASKPPPMIFAHANTFIEQDKVLLREYEPIVEGVVESWVQRVV